MLPPLRRVAPSVCTNPPEKFTLPLRSSTVPEFWNLTPQGIVPLPADLRKVPALLNTELLPSPPKPASVWTSSVAPARLLNTLLLPMSIRLAAPVHVAREKLSKLRGSTESNPADRYSVTCPLI